jgi:recombination protein RecT
MNNTVVKATRETLLAEIDAHRTQLTAALPPGADPDRFIALARQAVAEQPKLLDCSSASVLRALGQCAASGLPLDGKFSSLIVRQPKEGRPIACWDASYRGMTWLALESGFVIDVQSGVVREHDHFEYEQGSAPRLVHRVSLLPKCGEVIAAYATAKLRAGGIMIEILTRQDIARIKAMSPAADKGPWLPWADQMARKSAVRRLLKRLPAGAARLPSPSPSAPAIARIGDDTALMITPEDEFRLECRALELLGDADTDAALQAAWTAIVADYAQAGATTPVKVEARFHDRREALAQAETST